MVTRFFYAISGLLFLTLLAITAWQSYSIAQLALPYALRSILVILGGATAGLIASALWLALLTKARSLQKR